MDSKRLKLLERAYAAEVNAALSGHGLHMMQTKAALAETMVDEGYLAKCKETVSGATFEGYELTHVGRMAYCMECDEREPPPEPCPYEDHMGKHACTNRQQCWEPCGELGKSEEHAVAVELPNALAQPTGKAQL